MVGCRDDDAVDVLLLVQHLTEIRVASSLIELLLESDALRPVLLLLVLQLFRDLALGKGEIDIGEGDEILGLCQLQCVLGTHAAKADDGEVHRVARRLVSNTTEHVSRNDHHPDADPGRVRDELTTCDLLTRHERQLLQ